MLGHFYEEFSESEVFSSDGPTPPHCQWYQGQQYAERLPTELSEIKEEQSSNFEFERSSRQTLETSHVCESPEELSLPNFDLSYQSSQPEPRFDLQLIIDNNQLSDLVAEALSSTIQESKIKILGVPFE